MRRATTSELGSQQTVWSLDQMGLLLGPLAMVVWLKWGDAGSLSVEAHRLAGIMILTIIWWITEPIPIPVTGILSVSLAVILQAVPSDAMGKGDAATVVLAPFAHPSVFFLLGGVFIGRAMSRHGLDRRLALSVLCARWAGRSPTTILAAIGISVTAVSMWISNTAATAMMYPVTLGIITVLSAGSMRHRDGRSNTLGGTHEGDRSVHNEGSVVSELDGNDAEAAHDSTVPESDFARSPYATALLLMTAYASSVGGISTPIGTATNVVAIGFFKTSDYFDKPVDFLRWTMVGFPITVLIFIGLFLGLSVFSRRAELDMEQLREYLRAERDKLGPWKPGEVNTLVVFLAAITLWVTPGVLAILGLNAIREEFSRRFPEEIVAAICPVLLYLLPVDWRKRLGTLHLSDLSKVDWGTVLLFGAGLSLGGLMFKTGLAREVGQGLFSALGTDDVWSVTALAVVGGIVLSEFTSNAGTATALIPVTMAICQEANVDPIAPLIGVTLGASFGSALPVSTPPNAIVYSSGLIPIRRMVAAGVGVDVLSAICIWVILRIAVWYRWTPFV